MDLQSICQTVFISLIIIFLCHYFFYYLQASFTEPKVKDMINRPNEKYESIMKVVNSTDNINHKPEGREIPENNPEDSENQKDMKNELSNYINELTPSEINTDSGVPIPSNNFDNQELIYSSNNPSENQDSTPIDQLQATS